MKVEVSTDKPITDTVLRQVVASIEDGLARHKNRLTRVELHLKNVGGKPSMKPLECSLEVRPAGREPVVVSDAAASIEDAVAAAAGKMERLLESLFGRLDSTRGGGSASGHPT
ncbi:MAG: ribosomal subunit interface protein [Pirellulales bacterium]